MIPLLGHTTAPSACGYSKSWQYTFGLSSIDSTDRGARMGRGLRDSWARPDYRGGSIGFQCAPVTGNNKVRWPTLSAAWRRMSFLPEGSNSSNDRGYLVVGKLRLKRGHILALAVLRRVGELGVGPRLLPRCVCEVRLTLRPPVRHAFAVFAVADCALACVDRIAVRGNGSIGQFS